MAATDPKYNSGWIYTVLLDGVDTGTMGFVATDTVDEVDLTTNKDNGWTLTEKGCRSVSISFSIPVQKTDTASPMINGLIYPMTFMVNEVVKYNGLMIVTQATISNPIRGASTYDYVVKNYGNASVTYTPPSP